MGEASLGLSASIVLCPGFAATQCLFILFTVGQPLGVESHYHASPSASVFCAEYPLNSIKNLAFGKQ